MNDLEIEIKPSEREQLDFIQSEFSPNDFLLYHHQRHRVQEEGKGVFLIAWHHDNPVGHFLLRWEGPDEDISGKYPYPTPYLEAGGTKVEFRRKGIATRLIQRAEELAIQKGYKKIGLSVGSTDNPEARRLYEKLEYVDWGKGELESSWDFKSADGKTGRESEICIYMFKELK
jgi:GNAT superfamily N-acetyltransferase